MRKAGLPVITLILIFLLTSCTGNPNPVQSTTPGMTPGADGTPRQSAPIPLYKGDPGRAWRYSTYIGADALPGTIQQGDCSTTYDTITTDIADEGLRTWLEGQADAFTGGVVQDTSIIDKLKADIRDRGLEGKYLQNGLERVVKTTLTTSGAVVCIRTTDYVVDKEEAEYFGEYYEQTADGDGGSIDEETGMIIPSLPECYRFAIKTLCLNMLEKKPMKLADLFQPGVDVTGIVNHALNQEIAANNLEAGEVLKRPFTGIGADYPYFYIGDDCNIIIAFNEDNPWFDLQVQDFWCTRREMSVGLRGYQASPLLRDDSLAYAIDGDPASRPNGEEYLYRYMPDFGVCEWEAGGRTIRLTRMDDTAVMDRINAQIEEFEKTYPDDAAIMDNLFYIRARDRRNALVKEHAYAVETGNFLTIGHFIQVVGEEGNYGTTDLAMLFDLRTGKRLSYKDVMTGDSFSDNEDYDLYKGRLSTDYTNLSADGTVYLFYRFNPETDEYSREEGIPVVYDYPQGMEGEVDWTRCGALGPKPLPPGITEARKGYIRDIYTRNGQDYIDIDYADWYTGAEAAAMAEKDGKTVSKYGYYIRNNNPMIRTFPAAKDITIKLYDKESPPIDGIPARSAMLAELAELIRGGGKAMLFDADVENGWIVSLLQEPIQ